MESGGKAGVAWICAMVVTVLTASGHTGLSVGLPGDTAAIVSRAFSPAPYPGSYDGSRVGATPPKTGGTASQTGSLRVAVAANFRTPLNELAAEFERAHGIALSPTFGSSGLLAAQIRQGAPFDAFFSADRSRPTALIDDGLAAPPVTVYARGRVALWIPGTGNTMPGIGHRIGIPNPDLAPYGTAAVQCLQRLGLWQRLRKRLVLGNNVNQIDHFLASGALHRGFVALSQLVAKKAAPERYWVCPSDFHAPIDQGAVVLNRGRHPSAARALLRFMTLPAIQARLEQMGYVASD